VGDDAARLTARRRVVSSLGEFIPTKSAGGVVLFVATVVALVWANSLWDAAYQDLWHHELSVGVDRFVVSEDLSHWVNDGLMAIFFFVIGLEIKRELVIGELRDPKAATLPILAALGGMVVPALLFVAVAGGGEAGRGWRIPMATDIAFVIGVLALLGSRVPAGLKLFLLTLAIVDDLGAIAVIAVFYSPGSTRPGSLARSSDWWRWWRPAGPACGGPWRMCPSPWSCGCAPSNRVCTRRSPGWRWGC